MRNRILIVGGATLIAGMVLLISLLAGPPGPPGPPGSPGSPGSPSTQKQADPTSSGIDAVNPGFNLEDVVIDPAAAGQGVMVGDKGAEGGFYRFEHKSSDAVTFLYFDKVMPRPLGVSDLVMPRARTQFSAQRVMIITADQGILQAPQNMLRHGTFRNNVVVTLYQAAQGQELDMQTDRHVVARIYLDQVDFDMDLGTLESTGPVHLTGPQFDFHGTGLSVTYNDLEDRIERLVVYEGKSLRTKRGAGVRSTTADNSSATQPVAAAADSQPATTQAAPAKQHQFYHARFEDNVRITSDDDKTRMAGDYLEMIFSLDAADQNVNAGDSLGAVSQPSRPLPGNTAQTVAPSIAQTTPSIHAGLPDGRILAPVDSDDVIITWTGQLVIVPEPAPPVELAGSEDMLLRLVGTRSPATVTTPDDQHIQAGQVDYLLSKSRLGAAASAKHEMIVMVPDMGELRGRRLSLDQSRGNGYVIGPGRLIAAASNGHTTASPLQVSFTQRMDMTFTMQEQAQTLRNATFYGDVDLTARQDDLLRLNIRAQTLNIDLATDEGGQSYPQHVVAHDDVHVITPELELSSQMFDVTLAPAGAEADSSATQPAATTSEDYVLESLLAERQVQVKIADPQVTLTGQRLAYEKSAQQFDLFGQAGSLARMVSHDGSLEGQHIIFEQATQKVHVPGPGNFDVQIDPDEPDQILAVSWQEAMHFDNQAGHADFLGDVVARTIGNAGLDAGQGGDVTRLRSDDLKLTFETQAQAEARISSHSSDEHVQTQPDGDRELRLAIATGNVKFVSESRDHELDGKLQTRLALTGQKMKFTNTPPSASNADGVELIEVFQAGTMLIEDYRPEEIAASQNSKTNAPANMSGRGQTLFVWADKLTLDAKANNMILDKDVVMIHKPADGSDALQLDCQKLLADLEETGGLAAWGQEDAPQPRTRLIQADVAVRVIHGTETINADHMLYTQSDQIVRFWADSGRVVQVQTQGKPTPLEATSVEWNLATDRYSATHISSGIVPMGE